MAPVIGLSLATVVGSYKFFARSLVGLAIGSIMVFVVGVGAGLLGQVWVPTSLNQAYSNAELSVINFIVLTVGAVFTAATMAHHERSPAAPSVALAYTLYLPLVAAGFGLGSGVPHLFPDGLVVFRHPPGLGGTAWSDHPGNPGFPPDDHTGIYPGGSGHTDRVGDGARRRCV